MTVGRRRPKEVPMRNTLLICLVAAGACWVSNTEVSFALPPGGGATVSCECTCTQLGGGTSVTKKWTWGGTRSGCQDYNKSSCRLVGQDGANHYGTLHGCDTTVEKQTTPGSQAPPQTGSKPSTGGGHK